MNKNLFMDRIFNEGLTYHNYIQQLESILSSIRTDDLTCTQLDEFNGKKLNYQRITRIYKNYVVNEQLHDRINEINSPQIWMVLSEDWCGDSAQNLPYLARIAECNSIIEFKILFRDVNLDIMNRYLTDGNKSIPKLIVFDIDWNELFQWGPRPKEAQELVAKSKSEGKSKEQFLTDLHLWYSRNKGKNLEEEIFSLLKKENFIAHN